MSRLERQEPPGPFRERRAFQAERREEARKRDAARYRIAVERQGQADFAIPPAEGFLVLPPGAIEEAGAVVEAANELIDSIGHDELTARRSKGGFMAVGLIPDSGFELDSSYMRFALSEAV